MDDPVQFRCACGREFPLAKTCPNCGQMNPTHYQLADGSWVDRQTFSAQAMQQMKPSDVHICAINNGVKSEFTLESCPPELREQIARGMKQGLPSIEDTLKDFLKKHGLEQQT